MALKRLSSHEERPCDPGLNLVQGEGPITIAECTRLRNTSYGYPKFIALLEIVLAKSASEGRYICEKYLFIRENIEQVKVLVDAYHEQLLTREEAVKIAADVWDYAILWVQNVAVTKDGDTAARIADILDKHGMVDVARHIRVFVDVYHKDQLLTRKEAEEVAAVVLWEAIWESKCVEVAVTKDGDTAARIADILDKYGFNDVSQRIKVLVDVYHKEQLLTREEAEKIEYCRWEDIVITKDDVAATRIAEILDKYGFNVAQRLRVLVDVYHKEQLVTKEEAEEMMEWWGDNYVITKDGVTAARIVDIFDKYDVRDDDYKWMRLFVDIYHKEQLVTKEEAEKVVFNPEKCVDIAVNKDGDTAARMANILDKHGLNKFAQDVGILADAYHKEQLVTKEEAEKIASDEMTWAEVAFTKDGVTAARIADIMDKHGNNSVARKIRESSK